MRKTYLLDTSALIYDPILYKQYPDYDIIIPISVLNELDKLKKQPGEAGRNARVAIRALDDISNIGDISTGVLVENNTLIKVDATYYDLNLSEFTGFGDPAYGDTQILACAYANWLAHPVHDVTLISNDINLRIKSKARSIDAISHDGKVDSLSDLYAGNQVIINEEAGLDLQKCGYINPIPFGLNLQSNECILFKNEVGDGIAMGRKTSDDRVKLIKKIYPWGISARNKEQSFAIDLIMDKKLNLVTLIGKAGCGKTLITMAAALELVLSKKEYDKLIIYRPIQSVGNDIGFLPGEMSEKLAPYYSAIIDNFEVLLGSKQGSDWKRDLEMFQRKGRIEMEAITFIRGRSIPNAIMFIDEAQNLSRDEIKTILTRAGEGTKIILTGDLDQIDNRDLDATNNGLVYVIEKFKDYDIAGHVTFTQGERSRLATLAADIL